VQLVLLSFAYLGLKPTDPGMGGPVFGGMGQGHKSLFAYKDSAGNPVGEPMAGSSIADWKDDEQREEACFGNGGEPVLSTPAEVTFGKWMGSLVKAIGFDPGKNKRGEFYCWYHYEVLETLALVNSNIYPDYDDMVLDILTNGVPTATGRGSSDR
jgi:hypothetical protein